MKITIILSALLLASCANHVWSKTGMTDQSYTKDAYDCEKDARQSDNFGGGIMGGYYFQEFRARCMKSKGYVDTSDK